MLGVDRDDLPRLGERLDQRAADDERLLVGEREGAARFERGEGGREPDRPGDAVEYGVTLGGGELCGRICSGEDLGQRLPAPVPLAQGLPQRRYDVLAGDRDGTYPKPPRLLRQQPDPPARGGEPAHPEPAGIALHEVDGLRTDRPGGSQDHHVPWPVRGHGIEDKMRISEGRWTVTHPSIVAASSHRPDRVSPSRASYLHVPQDRAISALVKLK